MRQGEEAQRLIRNVPEVDKATAIADDFPPAVNEIVMADHLGPIEKDACRIMWVSRYHGLFFKRNGPAVAGVPVSQVLNGFLSGSGRAGSDIGSLILCPTRLIDHGRFATARN